MPLLIRLLPCPRVAAGLALWAVLLLTLAGLAAWWPDDPEPPSLRWGGGDSSGGEPLHHRTENGKSLSGFEGELALYLAEKLGRKSVFVAGRLG